MANDREDHALVADEEAPTEFALMANISTESKVFDNSLCSKDCKKNNKSLNRKIIDLTDKLFDAKNMIYHYKLGLAQVKSRLVEHKDREIKYCEKIRGLEFRTESNNECIEILKKKLEILKKEKEGVDGKLAGFLTTSKDLDNLIESQRADKNKDGLGYSVVPHPPAQIYYSSKKDLSWTGLLEFADDTVTDYSRPSPTIESTSGDDQNKNPFVFETEASPSAITPKPFIKFVKESAVQLKVKEYQEKDKIESKLDKNRKRGKARKSQKQLQWIEEEKLKKTQKEGPEMQTHANMVVPRNYNPKGERFLIASRFPTPPLAYIDSFNDIHPHFDDDPLSGSTTYSANSLLEEEIEFLLYQGEDSDFKDSIDQSDLASLDDLFVGPTPEMFTNEQPPDYSFPLRFDVDDVLPSLDNEDKVLNPGILSHEKSVKIITQVTQEKKLVVSYASWLFEDFDPPFYELLVFKEVPNSTRLLPFSSENEEKVFKPGIYASKKFHCCFLS
uniref:Reverse transcriptase domain-containing protein n=1 Tax=Tanacetum cinerariifolium TaxID=118510 RepID=A0A6L2L1Q2_TANCI|nr:hypothetical protein [Tanacetum cinerariifolium]